MDPDTRIGGPHNRFPETRGSILLHLNASDNAVRSRGWDTFAQVYWKPLYTYARFRWRLSNEEAKDLTQGFFQHALEKDFLRNYDAAQSAFRTFLRLCFDRYAAKEWQAAQRLKRGGAMQMESLHAALPVDADVEKLFHQEWVRSVFALSLTELERQCNAAGQSVQFAVFSRYDLCEAESRPTYASLGVSLGVNATAVTNYLAAMRRRLRQIVLDTLRELTASQQEYRNEARAVLGVEVE
jgi:hypothetical protein